MRLPAAAYRIGRAIHSATPEVIRRRTRRLIPFQAPVWHLPEHRILYIVVPKVATRSSLVALTSLIIGEPSLERISWSDMREAMAVYQRFATPAEIRRLARSSFSFAFVRNPLERLVSAYSSQMAADPSEKTIFQRHGIPYDAGFPEFVEIIASLPDEECDGHVRSQHTFVADADGVLVDYLGRFERLHEDWAPLVERLGLPALPRRNVSKHVPYTEMYKPALARLAAARYRRDIELFGYGDEVTRVTA